MKAVYIDSVREERYNKTVTHQELKQEIRQLAEVIAKNYQPEQIVLFGSAAKNAFKDGSDVDLMVVKETPKKALARTREVIDFLPHTIDVDILVLTPQELAARRAENHYLIKEIDTQGQILFERQVA